MIKIFLLTVLLITSNAFAVCRSEIKNYDLSDITNATLNTYADGKIRINLGEKTGEIVDLFDNRGIPYSGIIIKKTSFKETDDRFFLLKWISKKELKVSNFIEINLSDAAITNDIIGKGNQRLNMILKVGRFNYRFQVNFSIDLSPGCSI